jgi:hypothetical protein
MALTVLGMLIGLAGAAAASRTLVTLLFGVTRADPPTYVRVGRRVLAPGLARVAR